MRRTALVTPLLLALCAAPLAPASELDFFAPAVRELRKAYAAEREKQDAARRTQLEALIRENLERFEARLAQNRRTGNIRGMAVARNGIRIFERARTDLEQEGEFEWPARVRRELEETVEQVADQKREIDEKHARSLHSLDDQYAGLLVAEARRQGLPEPADADLRRWLDRLGAAPETAEIPPETGADLPDGPSPGAGAAPSREPEPGSEWVTLGLWSAEVNALTVLEVGLMNRRTPEETEGREPVTGGSYTQRYRPVRLLAADGDYAFRLRALPGHQPVGVLEWPQRGNGWTLSVRARPERGVPSRHGAEIQIAFPGAADLQRLDTGGEHADTSTNTPTIELRIRTEPAGAVVFLEGLVFRRGDRIVRTPCTLSVPAGLHNIRLRKLGCVDAVLKDVEISEDRLLTWTFEKDPGYADRTVTVSAATGWTASGIELRKGRFLLITASGTWHCGSKREEVDADGYPNDKRFFHYYLDPRASPRQLAGSPYGALLMRIGRDGPLRAVGRRLNTTADADGMLYFDINESARGSARRDNGGALTVRVQVLSARD